MLHKLRTTLAATVMVLALGGCGDDDVATAGGNGDGGQPDPDFTPARPDIAPGTSPTMPDFTPATYPKVDGSTSTIPLARVLACELLGVGYEWVEGIGDEGIAEIVPAPTTPEEEDIADWIMANIVHNKTHQSYLNLIDSVADLILVANPPSDEELAYAHSAQVTLEQDAVALDALVILRNSANPVTSLSHDQIRGIFMGWITNWSEVGGKNQPIHPYVRPHNSGSQQLMDAIVMEGLEMPPWPEGQTVGFMGALIDGIQSDPFAIGYSVYYYVTFQYPHGGHKAIAVDGVQAGADTIGSKTYRYTAPVWVIVRADLDPSSTAAQLRDWLLTPTGQHYVGKSGYVELPHGADLPPTTSQ